MSEDISCAAGCGACCDPVRLPTSLADLIARCDLGVSEWPDPTTDGGWAVWRSRGWTPFDRDKAIGYYANQINGDFAKAHWTQLEGPLPAKWDGGAHVVCDAFDPVSRLCTAHEKRPPVCSGYPRYGLPPGDPGIPYGDGMEPACTYNADVRTMLPIVAVTSGRR